MTHRGLGISAISTEDFRHIARKKLPRQFFDYIDGGSYSETTLRQNINSFAQIELRQRVLRDVSHIDTSTRIFNRNFDLPLVLAPVGLAGCYARRGEVQAFLAAAKANIPFTLSTVGICSIEELHRSDPTSFWFQLYVIRDRKYALDLMQRARAAGCDTLVFTVDLPVLGERYRDKRNGLSGGTNWLGSFKRAVDFARHPAWIWNVAIRGRPFTFGNLQQAVPNANSLSDFKRWVDSQFDASMTWKDLHWIRENWSGNFVIKGILDSEDARKAVEAGADGIVVSNHGGRQLDGAPASLSVLPEIVDVIKGECKVFLDSGVRSGLDIVKAIALGADGCMVGRAWAYALAAAGEKGVAQVIKILKDEIKVAMALTGVSRIQDIDRRILRNR
ncbi:L-lactate dehydrogenase [Aliikangiella sp. G2MR2-5]|uniref:L-lactate dehydrogenase n=1 Tax=Aliikangiella sp. G2MR2-5 TaxID=2788943 RepID=UPI001FF07BF5|nr:L-lactate dehydrogenase [Aliikangiella sp. G2MR2-5]